MTFKVGDKVRMPGVPVVVEVLALNTCMDPDCDRPTFIFADPITGDDDEMHCDQFELVTP
jgi:hypothetical protein